jgi:hypothetical protein
MLIQPPDVRYFWVFFLLLSQQASVPKQRGKQRPVVDPSGSLFLFVIFFFPSLFSTQENKDNHSPQWQGWSARSMSLVGSRKRGQDTSRLKLAPRTVKKGQTDNRPGKGGSRVPSGSATRRDQVLDHSSTQFIFGLPPYKSFLVKLLVLFRSLFSPAISL